MAPLHLDEVTVESNSELQCGVFSNERFADPLIDQLDRLASADAPKKRRVQFNREQDIIMNPEQEYFTEEDIQIKWWGPEDLQLIRQNAKLTSARLRHHAKSQDCDLTMAHRKTTLILAADFSSLVKLPPTSPDQDLSSWCSHADGRRGLERFASKVYASFRRRDVANTRASVLSEQARQRFEQINDVEAIAQKSREASKRARSFALFFGGADSSQVNSSKRTSQQAPPIRRAPPRKRSKMFHPIDELRAAA